MATTTDAQSLKSLFHSLGLRSTGARIAVYRALSDAERPLTHAEVSAQLEDAGFDHATIFRNLNDLAQAGLVVRTDLGDHVWRFELRGDGKQSHREQHPHFLCTDCGHVSCLPEGAIALKRVKGTPKALASDSVVVQVQGLCDTCRPQAGAR
ncbi:MAG: transcriptional repressor [Myxococcales bacterium]|nr:transcriptional repressor [Myxococcales bacterium]